MSGLHALSRPLMYIVLCRYHTCIDILYANNVTLSIANYISCNVITLFIVPETRATYVMKSSVVYNHCNDRITTLEMKEKVEEGKVGEETSRNHGIIIVKLDYKVLYR